MAIRWRTIRKYLSDAWDTTEEGFGVKVLGPEVVSGQTKALEHTLSGATDETINLPDGTKKIRLTATTVGGTYVRYALDEACAAAALTTSFTTGGVLLVNVAVEKTVSNAGTSSGVLHLRGTTSDVIVVEVF